MALVGSRKEALDTSQEVGRDLAGGLVPCKVEPCDAELGDYEVSEVLDPLLEVELP